jgi:hypothetical protein
MNSLPSLAVLDDGIVLLKGDVTISNFKMLHPAFD